MAQSQNLLNIISFIPLVYVTLSFIYFLNVKWVDKVQDKQEFNGTFRNIGLALISLLWPYLVYLAITSDEIARSMIDYHKDI